MTDNGSMSLIEKAASGIIITAQTFNPSIFTETWLSQNHIIDANDLIGLRVFSAEMAQFQTSDMRVLVIPPKMQITFPIPEVEGDFESPKEVAARTVELLPHTPYQALGLNFDFFATQPADQNFSDYDRTLLGSGDYQLLREFSSSDSRFGRYFSKDYEEARLKLNIKPVKKVDPGNQEILQFSFNFHYEVSQLDSDDRVEKLIQLIGTWNSLKQYAQHLVVLGSKIEEKC